jgi:hypothetical protein
MSVESLFEILQQLVGASNEKQVQHASRREQQHLSKNKTGDAYLKNRLLMTRC